MTEIKVLRLSYMYAAFVFGTLSISMLPMVIRSPFPHATPYFHLDLLGVLLIVMRQLILMLPPALAVTSGAAWWTHPVPRRPIWRERACVILRGLILWQGSRARRRVESRKDI